MVWSEWFRKQVSPEGSWANAVALVTAVLVAGAGLLRLVLGDGHGPSSFWSSDMELFSHHLGPVAVWLVILVVLALALGAVAKQSWIIGVTVLVVVAFGCWELWTRTEPSTVLWLILAAVGAAALLSHYFTRRSLLVFVAVMGVLVVVGTVRVGQRTTDEKRVEQAKSELVALMGERCQLSVQARQGHLDALEAAESAEGKASQAVERAIAAQVDPAVSNADVTTRLLDLGSADVEVRKSAITSLADFSVPVQSEVMTTANALGKAAGTTDAARDAVAADAKADPEHLVSAGQWVWSSWPESVTAPRKDDPVADSRFTCRALVAGAADNVKPNQFGIPDDPAHRSDFNQPPDWIGTLHDPSARGLEEHLAGARLAMATARLDAPDADAEKAAADVDARRQELATAVSASGLDAEPTSLLDLLSTGANTLVGTLPVFRSLHAPAELTLVGWILIGGLGLIVLRRLVIHSARRGMGPVEVHCSDETKEATVGAYVARNLPEPGTVPDSSSLAPITDLAAGFAPAATWVSKVADAITNVVNVPSGYTAKFTALDAAGSSTTPAKVEAKTETDAAATAEHAEQDAPPATAVAIAVVVADVRTRRVHRQTVIKAKEGGDLWRSASYWAAAVVLDRALDVPPWGHWRPEASRALASFAEEIDRYEVDDTEDSTDELLAALRDAPDNGLVLMNGASTFNLKDDPVASFNLALQAAHHHPDYLLARYRLSIQASALAAQIDEWEKAPAGDRLKICKVLRRTERDEEGLEQLPADHLEKLSVDLAKALESDTNHQRQEALIRFGKGHAEAMRKHLRVWNLVPGLLSRTERRTTRHLMMWDTQRLTGRRRLYDLARSVVFISEVRRNLLPLVPAPSADEQQELVDEEREISRRADAFASGWQLAYNIACLWAIRAGAAQAAVEAAVGADAATKAAAEAHAAAKAAAEGEAAAKAEAAAVADLATGAAAEADTAEGLAAIPTGIAAEVTATAAAEYAAAAATAAAAARAAAAAAERASQAEAEAKAVAVGAAAVASAVGPAATCRDEAFSYIWKALERPGSSTLTTRWVKHDPDLRALQDDERWGQLLERLSGNES